VRTKLCCHLYAVCLYQIHTVSQKNFKLRSEVARYLLKSCTTMSCSCCIQDKMGSS